ncbi:RISC-loading complex subunit tarbp2-like isoform X2 [Bradysia coprophila]|nr:RISC-loading complex subunit tarbp2-like isoform X2 [Bradysia coprophila]
MRSVQREQEHVQRTNDNTEYNVKKIQNPVGYLQEMCAKYGFSEPTYGILKQNGPHDTAFSIFCQVQGYYRVVSSNTQEKGKEMAAREIILCIKRAIDLEYKNRNESLICKDLTKAVAPETLSENSSENTKRNVNYVGILQELCVRKHLPPPNYGTENVTGTPNNPSFYIFCEVGPIKGYGIARNKKSAKQMAAEKVLEQFETMKTDLFDKESKQVENNEIHQTALTTKRYPLLRETPQETFTVVPNPVGHLQELCVKNRLRPPIYEVVKMDGPSHCPTFITSCKVEYFYQEATSSNKKKGKELAALKILKCLMEYRSPPEIADI